ncbi:hypothetical protein OIU84_018231 [Salix udensis]|uniref:Uncharacterized protein n=1 Tax=Salix udensis TaxID=889485 RepID=A0AAD6J7U6_9ROSI|nr:hypothetical protein OIU84_018231 [Salix udensis]
MTGKGIDMNKVGKSKANTSRELHRTSTTPFNQCLYQPWGAYCPYLVPSTVLIPFKWGRQDTLPKTSCLLQKPLPSSGKAHTWALKVQYQLWSAYEQQPEI